MPFVTQFSAAFDFPRTSTSRIRRVPPRFVCPCGRGIYAATLPLITNTHAPMHKSHALLATKLRRLLWHEATTLTNITEGSLIGFCLSLTLDFGANEFLIMKIWRNFSTLYIAGVAINRHLQRYKFQYEDINVLIGLLVRNEADSIPQFIGQSN